MLYPFTKNDQIKKYLGQFIRVFSGFQVQDGVPRNGSVLTKRVPVVYGNMSRVTAHILNKKKFSANKTLPFMAVNMSAIQPDPQRQINSHHVDHISQYDIGKNTSLTRIHGPAFILTNEVSIYASSTTELFQLVEQILLIFNPRVTFQIDNRVETSDYITDITLVSIQPEIQYPMSTSKQVVMLTLTFEVPIRLRYPFADDGNVIEMMRIAIKDENTEDTYIQTIIPDDDDDEEEEVNP